MINKLNNIKKAIGHTPLIELEKEKIHLYTKFEFLNFTGSVKVWPAYHILSNAIKNNEINEESTIIESTSGNFGVALATLCNILNIKFIPVIDPNINPVYEKQLQLLSTRVVKVMERDETGGYLLTRIRCVKELMENTQHGFWINQYENANNWLAYYHGLGKEIVDCFDKLDYVFLGVSSGGTVTGLSRRLKEKFKNLKVIAVDTEGSVIFGQKPKKRFIPGIGSSMVPPILQEALIDEVIHIPETKAIEGCYELLKKYSLFVGGSSGSVYYAIRQYFKDKTFDVPPNVLFLCVDSGNAYLDTVYNKEWVQTLHEQYTKSLV